MSQNFLKYPTTKKLYLNNKNKYRKSLKKKSNSQAKYSRIPDIISQMKPIMNNLYNLDNLIKLSTPHQLALTPNNHSKILNKDEELLLPKKSPEYNNKKTLILDLDETLVHSSFTPFENNDIILNVDFDGMIYNIYVLVRPGAEYFIRNISKYYELVIFTASLSNYASPLLDILDKEENIKYRLYRENCTFMNGIYIKDLKKLNRNLKDLIIVDNSPLAYTFDIDNGLPIKTWYEDKKDVELYKISGILKFLATTKDVRSFIRKFVKRNEIVYDEAMNIIKNFENKKIKINNSNISNSNLINENNYDNNNISSMNSISTSKNINNTNNIKLINDSEDNVIFNKERFELCEGNVVKGNSKSISENEKSFNNENNKKKLKATTMLYKTQNKKNKLFNFNDNINFEKKKNNFLENKKINNNNKLRLKNNNSNIFRLKRKNEIKPNNSNMVLNLNNSSNIKKPIMPIALSTTNMKSILFRNNIFRKKDENNKKMINNYINLIQDNKEKNKYKNLLREVNKDNIKNNLENKNILKFEKFGLNNNIQKSKLRVSSSISSHRNFTPLNANKKNNKKFISFNAQRSKSSGNLFNNKKIFPKTPNGPIFNNLKYKYHKLLDYGEINLRNTNNYFNLNDYKYRRIQTAKKIMNKNI